MNVHEKTTQRPLSGMKKRVSECFFIDNEKLKEGAQILKLLSYAFALRHSALYSICEKQ